MDYNINTKLGSYVIDEAKSIQETTGKITFRITDYKYNLKEIENLKGKKGILSLNKFSIHSFEEENYLFFSGRLNDGTPLDDHIIQKMFRVESSEEYNKELNEQELKNLEEDIKIYSNKIFNESIEKNNNYLNSEIVRINNWADDKIQAIEFEVEQMREQRKELRKQSDLSMNAKDKSKIEKDIVKLTERIAKKWMELSENEEKVEKQRAEMVEAIKKENRKTSQLDKIFTVEFEVV